MKADLPQRVQLNTRLWDKPLPVVSPVARSPHTQGGAGAAAVKPGTEKTRLPHPLTDIYTELVKLFRDL
jgi:hypothetical protein